MTLREHDSWVMAIACSPDGKFIVSGSSDDLVILWDAMQGKPLKKRKVNAKGGQRRRIQPGQPTHRFGPLEQDPENLGCQ